MLTGTQFRVLLLAQRTLRPASRSAIAIVRLPQASLLLRRRFLLATPIRRAPVSSRNKEEDEDTFAAASNVTSTVKNTFRNWTFDDDHKLLAAVNKHGNDWTTIQAENFPDRHRNIVRQRWLKHVDPALNVGNRWTVADDLVLLKEIASGKANAISNASKLLHRHMSYVNKRFDFHWRHHLLIQAYGGDPRNAVDKFETRIRGKPFSPAFCRAAKELVDELSLLPPTSQHRRKYDDKAMPFTEDEDKRLLEAVRDVGTKWGTIQREFPLRTQSDLSDHYIKLKQKEYISKHGIRYHPQWTAEENELIREGRKRFGKSRSWALRTWEEIIPWRTPCLITNHWRRVLSPEFDRGEFTKEEMALLQEAVQTWDIHTQMKQIRRFFLPRRLPEVIRKAYSSLPATEYRPWTRKDTALLDKLMAQNENIEAAERAFPDRTRYELVAQYMRDVPTDPAAVKRRKRVNWKKNPKWTPELDEYVTRMKSQAQMDYLWIARQLGVPHKILLARHGFRSGE
ncbi:hypothetical protein HDU86_004131 [Geranomyces michiganensis]|nr:hypothetical protein HDU86_004131 [Geranomyces michiganensis]